MVERLAEADDVEPDALGYRLYDYVDHRILEKLDRRDGSGWALTFQVPGREVTVTAGGTVAVDGTVRRSRYDALADRLRQQRLSPADWVRAERVRRRRGQLRGRRQPPRRPGRRLEAGPGTAPGRRAVPPHVPHPDRRRRPETGLGEGLGRVRRRGGRRHRRLRYGRHGAQERAGDFRAVVDCTRSL